MDVAFFDCFFFKRFNSKSPISQSPIFPISQSPNSPTRSFTQFPPRHAKFTQRAQRAQRVSQSPNLQFSQSPTRLIAHSLSLSVPQSHNSFTHSNPCYPCSLSFTHSISRQGTLSSRKGRKERKESLSLPISNSPNRLIAHSLSPSVSQLIHSFKSV